MTGWKTWAALEEVTAANMNSYVRDQTVQVFTNSASRAAAITSPTKGLVSYLTDTAVLEVYYGATTGWRQPWLHPWGPLAQPHTLTTTFSTTGTHTTYQDDGLTLSIPYVANRLLKITVENNYSIGGATGATQRLLRTSTTIREFLMAPTELSTTDTLSRVWSTTFATTSTATETIKTQIKGTSNQVITCYGAADVPRRLLVEDIGPANYTPPSA